MAKEKSAKINSFDLMQESVETGYLSDIVADYVEQASCDIRLTVIQKIMELKLKKCTLIVWGKLRIKLTQTGVKVKIA